MYGWLWAHLPGGRLLRALQCLLLAAVAVVLLFAVVFPRVEAQLPYDDNAVQQPAPTASPSG